MSYLKTTIFFAVTLLFVVATSDIVDASVALAAAGSARTQPTTVITSDVEDIALLLDQLAGSAKIVQA